jgi:hypothetical protein
MRMEWLGQVELLKIFEIYENEDLENVLMKDFEEIISISIYVVQQFEMIN